MAPASKMTCRTKNDKAFFDSAHDEQGGDTKSDRGCSQGTGGVQINMNSVNMIRKTLFGQVPNKLGRGFDKEGMRKGDSSQTLFWPRIQVNMTNTVNPGLKVDPADKPT